MKRKLYVVGLAVMAVLGIYSLAAGRLLRGAGAPGSLVIVRAGPAVESCSRGVTGEELDTCNGPGITSLRRLRRSRAGHDPPGSSVSPAHR